MAKKESINRNEYLQLLGLAVIAKQGYERVEQARDAMHAILGTSEEEADDGSWIGDTVWQGSTDIDNMLKMMKVRVEENADAAKG